MLYRGLKLPPSIMYGVPQNATRGVIVVGTPQSQIISVGFLPQYL